MSIYLQKMYKFIIEIFIAVAFHDWTVGKIKEKLVDAAYTKLNFKPTLIIKLHLYSKFVLKFKQWSDNTWN